MHAFCNDSNGLVVSTQLCRPVFILPQNKTFFVSRDKFRHCSQQFRFTIHQQIHHTSTVADLLLCLCCMCVFSGNFLHAAQHTCDLLVLLGLERFSYGRGLSRPLSFQVWLHPCLHIILAMYSEFICIHMIIACHHVHRLHSLHN
jgi:hypothetical protein